MWIAENIDDSYPSQVAKSRLHTIDSIKKSEEVLNSLAKIGSNQVFF